MGASRAKKSHLSAPGGPIFRGFWLALLAGLCFAPLGLADPAEEEKTGLGPSLERALSVPALDGARIGALVVRASDGVPIWAENPDVPLIPASNMKILTALIALEVFGPTHRFETHILSDRLPGLDGTVAEIAVLGGGDPVMNSEDWWRLAADLRRSGLRKVEGDLVVDDSAFDSQFWHPAWGSVSARAYHGPVGALTANYGSYFVRVWPGQAVGQPARVQIDPPVEYLQLSNRALTSSEAKRTRLTVARRVLQTGREQVSVAGSIPVSAEADLFARSVRDPALYAGSILKLQLEALGISVAGTVRRGRADQEVELLRFKGRPLAEVVSLAIKYSNNSMMEILLKAMGARDAQSVGTWGNGLRILERELVQLGLMQEGVNLSDGSGLSVENRLTARMLVAVLRRAEASFRVGPELLAALPIAGRDGTLDDRLSDGVDRIRAKTGLLSDARVLALSGWAEGSGGERLVFSIMVNGYTGSQRAAMEAIDDWASLLVAR